jgi:hypothetical protein
MCGGKFQVSSVMSILKKKVTPDFPGIENEK